MLGMWDGRVNLSLNLSSDLSVAANILILRDFDFVGYKAKIN